MLTKVSIIVESVPLPPYEYYCARCDGCGVEHPEHIPLFMGEAHLLPEGWSWRTTHRKGWPGYALGYDLCPACVTAGAQPGSEWEARWAQPMEKSKP